MRKNREKRKTIFSENVVSRRIELEWTQSKLAKASGLSLNTIKEIEGGTSQGYLVTKELVAKALGRSVQALSVDASTIKEVTENIVIQKLENLEKKRAKQIKTASGRSVSLDEIYDSLQELPQRIRDSLLAEILRDPSLGPADNKDEAVAKKRD